MDRSVRVDCVAAVAFPARREVGCEHTRGTALFSSTEEASVPGLLDSVDGHRTRAVAAGRERRFNENALCIFAQYVEKPELQRWVRTNVAFACVRRTGQSQE